MSSSSLVRNVLLMLEKNCKSTSSSNSSNHYNQDMHNSISECTLNFAADGLQVQTAQSACQETKLRLQFTQIHQHWIIEDQTNVVWSGSQCLLQHLNECMNQSCLVSSTWGWCNSVGNCFQGPII